MNRRPNVRQHRRFSLPATPTQTPVVVTRKLPEGSGDFQKAFEDLCVNEPNHARSQSQVNTFGEFGFNGLNKIQELNESDYVESDEEGGEDEVDGPPVPQGPLGTGRRHSSPSFFTDRADQEHFRATNTDKNSNNEKKTGSKPSANNSVVKSYTKLRKEYFIKHGHFPVGNGQKPVNRLRPSSYHSEPRMKSGFVKNKT